MTKKVVPFKPVARRSAPEPVEAAARLAPGARRAVASLGPGEPEASAFGRTFAVESEAGAEIADSLALLQRETAITLRGPLERHLAGMARLASCRTPAQLVTTQASLANEAVCAALADSARLAESWTRYARAAARMFEAGSR